MKLHGHGPRQQCGARLTRARQLVTVAVAVSALVVATAVSPVGSQEDPPTKTAPPTAPPTTAAPTTVAPATTAAPATSTSTSDAPSSETSTDEQAPDASTTTTIAGEGDESTTTIDPDSPAATDPLVDEGPSEAVPGSSGRYATQPEFVEPTISLASVRAAEQRLAEAKDEHLDAIARVKALRLRLKELRLQIAGLDAETRRVVEDLAAAQELLELRALTAFVRGDSFESMTSIDHDEILASMAQQTMIESVFDQDEDVIETIERLRERLGTDVEAVFDRVALVEGLEVDAVAAVVEALDEIDQAELELRAFEAGSQIFIDGLVFPVGLGVETPLIDSFGFPRMTGTPDEHWHEGIDIFAPTGTPLLATENGVITRIGTGRLGGLKLWLQGESGTDWYYAHLSAFNPDLREGDEVEAGDLVGYVGQSGNAVGTPPHLHMQMHPDGGRPINPYPLLNMRLELDTEAALAEESDS